MLKCTSMREERSPKEEDGAPKILSKLKSIAPFELRRHITLEPGCSRGSSGK